MTDPRTALISALTSAGILDPDERAMIAAVVGGESGFQPRTEMSYAHTQNDRLRMLFGTKPKGWLPADEDGLTSLKADDVSFFDAIYGGRYGNVPGTDDGFTFRGRGLFQLTFRGNYHAIGQVIGQDLEANPELVNDADIGAHVVVAYVQSRYRGGGFEAMLACVGWNYSDIATTKNALYQQFIASGEWAA